MSNWINDYCLTLKGATADYQTDWEAMKFCIGDKMFAMHGEDKEGKAIITIKLKPEMVNDYVIYILSKSSQDIT